MMTQSIFQETLSKKFESNKIMGRPSHSRYLNPIENLWHELKIIHKQKPKLYQRQQNTFISSDWCQKRLN